MGSWISKVFKNSIPGKFANSWKIKPGGIIAMKFAIAQIHFWVTFPNWESADEGRTGIFPTHHSPLEHCARSHHPPLASLARTHPPPTPRVWNPCFPLSFGRACGEDILPLFRLIHKNLSKRFQPRKQTDSSLTFHLSISAPSQWWVKPIRYLSIH